MNSGWFRVLILAPVVIVAWGCAIIVNPCSDVTCDEGEVCVDGVCEPAPECLNDEDCGAGEVCDNGECIPEPECQSDSDCDGGEVCNEATNTCVECEGDADCDDDDACTTDDCTALGCTNLPIPCTSAATCPDGCDTACSNGFCRN